MLLGQDDLAVFLGRRAVGLLDVVEGFDYGRELVDDAVCEVDADDACGGIDVDLGHDERRGRGCPLFLAI